MHFRILVLLKFASGGVVANHINLELVLLGRHGDKEPSAGVDHGYDGLRCTGERI